MKKNSMPVALAALIVLTGFVLSDCASIKGEIQMDLGLPEKTYISPGIADGVQDTLTVPITVVPVEKVAVSGYKFSVLDASGVPVYESEVGVKTVPRGPKPKTKVDIPEKLVWDGRSNSGALVPDGQYTYQIEGWDVNGNTGKSRPLIVVVDNTPPSLELSLSSPIFSPNGDGNLDTLTVRQRNSTEEPRWSGAIRDSSGKVLKSLEWEERASDFDWDGRDDAGKLSPDGVYAYAVSSTDLAGNSATFELKNIILDARVSEVAVYLEYASFSPNGDGKKDVIYFLPVLTVKEGINSWNLDVYDSTAQIRRSLKGESEIGERLEFDGKDASGKVLPEGAYTGVLSILYINGNNPRAVSAEFTVDVTAPWARIEADLDVFSPNGDGSKDFVTLTQDASEEELWTGIIRDSSGRTVRTISWQGKAEGIVVWRGQGDDGMLLPDGAYTYNLQSTDLASNYGESERIEVAIDTEDKPVILSVDLTHFSPNGDGIQDQVRIVPHLKVTAGIETFDLSIKDASGRRVKGTRITGRAPEVVVWDGLGEAAEKISDGEFTAELEVRYRNGDRNTARSMPFVLDTLYPQAEVSSDYRLFSPDGDGQRDTIRITQKTSEEDRWVGEIMDSKKQVVKSTVWEGKAGEFQWDGKDKNGNRVPDGLYVYVVYSADRAGNRTEATLGEIEVDARPTPVSVNTLTRSFSPNGDGVKDFALFNLSVGIAQRIRSWSLSIVGTGDQTLRRFTGLGDTTFPHTVRWDGKSDRGTVVDGLYHAVFNVEYEKGNRPQVRTQDALLLDVTPPEVSIKIYPVPFSPDNDGVDDTVTISFEVKDRSPVEKWSAAILDPTGKEFISFSASGTPTKPIVWNGLSRTGELVQAAYDYPLVFTVQDDLANSTTEKRLIPVDVLVMRDGDRLKIVISSIHFKPYTADYISIPKERAEKNLQTLDRVAEILKKFGAYRIRLEGHAVQEYWFNARRVKREEEEELLPLSQKRADAIRDALVERGIEASRMTTYGYGGSQPIVPHSDRDNHWKNRRVEFILLK